MSKKKNQCNIARIRFTIKNSSYQCTVIVLIPDISVMLMQFESLNLQALDNATQIRMPMKVCLF